MPQEKLYTHGHGLPDFLVRDRINLIECPVYDAGTLTAPASGTVGLLPTSVVFTRLILF